MKREYDDYLRDMLDNAEKALSFVDGLDYDGFCKDDKAMYAVIRAFEIIGEAARQIPEDVREANSEIPWREITGMRNKLTDEYFGVNTKVVWRTVHEDLPVIIPALREMLGKK
ncbi:MAG: DUF86 domain-containing protein [Anaerolineales bacterium]|nr:DUF86 domain-containing protein [Anaerolineales bacterium]